MQINVPVPWAVQGYGVPDVCVRHGRPATPRRVRVTAYPAWTWLFLFLGIIGFVLVRAITGKTLALPAWPVCDLCRRRRSSRFVVSGGLLVLGLAAMVVPFAIDGPGPGVVLLGLLGLVAGFIVLASTSWSKVVGVRVDEPLMWLIIGEAHPEFQARFAPFQVQLQEQLRSQSQLQSQR